MDPARRRRLALGLIALVAILGAAGLVQWRRAGHTPVTPTGGRTTVPGDSDRVQVEVLNAWEQGVGMARIATWRLRDRGLDVVYWGTDTLRALDSTQILVRRGDAAQGERVRKALGAGTVRTAPDGARLVDVTVRLGADFAALVRQP